MSSTNANGRPDEVFFCISSKHSQQSFPARDSMAPRARKVPKTVYSDIREAGLPILLTLSPRAVHCYSLLPFSGLLCVGSVRPGRQLRLRGGVVRSPNDSTVNTRMCQCPFAETDACTRLSVVWCLMYMASETRSKAPSKRSLWSTAAAEGFYSRFVPTILLYMRSSCT